MEMIKLQFLIEQDGEKALMKIAKSNHIGLSTVVRQIIMKELDRLKKRNKKQQKT